MPILIITVIILIFPFFPSVYFYLKKDEKTCGFDVKIFGIKVFSLAATWQNDGIYVKKTFKKPYYLRFSWPVNMRGKIKTFKKIGILSLNSTMNIGLSDGEFSKVLAVSTVDNVQIALFNALKTQKPFLKLQHAINVYEDSDIFDAAVKMKTVFNIVDILTVLFYYLTEKIYYGISK